MDTSLFRAINNWPDSLAPIFVFFSEATKNPVGKILFAILALALLINPKTRKALLFAILAVGLANLTCDVLKAGLQGTRPCVDLDNINLRVGKLTSFGTASAHSANMAAVATVFLKLHGKWGLIWFGVAIITGLSRIYVGVHYPYQVALGWLVGAFCAYLLLETWNVIQRRKTRQSTDQPADSS